MLVEGALCMREGFNTVNCLTLCLVPFSCASKNLYGVQHFVCLHDMITPFEECYTIEKTHSLYSQWTKQTNERCWVMIHSPLGPTPPPRYGSTIILNIWIIITPRMSFPLVWIEGNCLEVFIQEINSYTYTLNGL